MTRLHAQRLAALGLVVLIAGVFVVAAMLYTDRFTATVPVTVRTERAGLNLDVDAKVKSRGVVVGRVARVEYATDGAVLHLDIDAAGARDVPANSTVLINSTTAFGAKYVNFVPPDTAPVGSLVSGATFEADAVTVEINTVFENLSSVLRSVEPEKLNATLGSLAAGLRGRGEELGEVLDLSNTYLAGINAHGQSLRHDIDAGADVAAVYADASPGLLDILRQATVSADTVVAEQANLDLTLLELTGLGDSGGAVLEENNPALTTMLAQLVPTTDILSYYAPEFPCMFGGYVHGSQVGLPVYGGQPGIRLQAGLLPGVPTYTVENNLPKVAAKGGPYCLGLPQPDPNAHAPFVVADTGANPHNPILQQPQINFGNVFDVLYGVPFEGGTR
ncbi:MCE family protein [Rhodococcus sp. HNM0569]|uniref:MCE family protein n=1 Tax=Rhodococcus sp. HNM0569 TaxID=2716340 RepID=UPI00146D9601|nr:MCE family protein [Rhodococcus sp. HNM0569]